MANVLGDYGNRHDYKDAGVSWLSLTSLETINSAKGKLTVFGCPIKNRENKSENIEGHFEAALISYIAAANTH